MTLINQHIQMWGGDDLSVAVTVQDENAAALDITGATAQYVVYNETTGANVLTKATGGSGITLTDAANGVLTIAFDPADTSTVNPGAYYHELEVTDVGGNISTVFTGTFVLNPSRT